MRDSVKALRDYKGSSTFHAFMGFMEMELQVYRRKNDTAKGDEVIRNQGVIVYLRELLKQLGYDEDKSTKIYDEGYTN